MFRPDSLRIKHQNITEVFTGRGKTHQHLRSWVEDSYFRPFGQRTLSNQALYSASGVVVIYTRLAAANIMKYVSNRAAWLGRQDLMRSSSSSSSTLSDDEPIIQRFSNTPCGSGEPEMGT